MKSFSHLALIGCKYLLIHRALYKYKKSNSSLCSENRNQNTTTTKSQNKVHSDLSELYLEHLFVLSRKEGHGAKDQLEQLEVQVGELHVGAHFRQAVQEVLHQNCSKQSRGSRVRQEGIGNDLSQQDIHVTKIIPSSK